MADACRVRAIASFNASRYGSFIRLGQIFFSEPDYAQELVRKKLVELVQDTPKPQRHQAMMQAPNLGKAQETDPPLSPGPPLAVPQADGKARPSRSSRAGPRSPRRMRRGAAGDAK